MALQVLDSCHVLQSAKGRLRSRFDIGGDDLSREYRNSVLYLRGWCSSYYEKQMAQEAVRSVDGVRGSSIAFASSQERNNPRPLRTTRDRLVQRVRTQNGIYLAWRHAINVYDAASRKPSAEAFNSTS